MSSARDYLEEAQGIVNQAKAEGRPMTAEEASRAEDCLRWSKGAADDRLKALRSSSEHPVGGMRFASADAGGDPGERFVSSEGYLRIKDASARASSWTTGKIDCGLMQTKGTLLEGSGSPGTGTGGGLVPTPQVAPGIVQQLFQPLTLESLLLSGQASGNQVRYAVEGTATSSAAGVAEAGTKPESTLAFSTKDEPIKKIATVVSISDELIKDAPAVQTFVNGQLSSFVQTEAERQLFRGTSGGNEVQGLLTSRGVPVYAGGTAAGDYAAQLFKAMNGVRGSAFVEPEWIVIHPTDYQTLRLLRDQNDQYLGGGPFLGAYGGPQGPAGASGQVSGALDSVWGKAVYVTSNIGNAGTALIGSRQAGQVWSRGGVSVEASNSHDSYFTSNLTAIRAERRLGLTLYRPGAMCEVRLA
jgi:HK97 family phage major capsid protein